MSGLLDDEWCRRVFPLLTRRELRVCAALMEIGDRPTSSTEIAELAELAPRNARQVLQTLERARVISRKKGRGGLSRLRLLPDAIRAEKTLAEWGREAPPSLGLVGGFRLTARGVAGSPDHRIAGSPEIRLPDHGDPTPLFSPIDRAPRRACVDAGHLHASDLGSDQAQGGRDQKRINLPSSLPLGTTHAHAATPPAGGDLLSLDLGRLVSLGRELWGARWHRTALGRWLAPLLGLEATAAELEAWLRWAAAAPEIAALRYPPAKAGDRELAGEWLAALRRRRAPIGAQRVCDGSEFGEKQPNSATARPVPPPAGCSVADVDRMARAGTAPRRRDRDADRATPNAGARSAAIGAPGGGAGPRRGVDRGATPLGGLLGSVLADLSPPSEAAPDRAIGGELSRIVWA